MEQTGSCDISLPMLAPVSGVVEGSGNYIPLNCNWFFSSVLLFSSCCASDQLLPISGPSVVSLVHLLKPLNGDGPARILEAFDGCPLL